MNKVRQYETEFSVGVAAAAYVVNSAEKDEARHRIPIGRSRQDTISRVRNSDRSVTRRYSSNEVRTAGETSIRKPMESSKGGGSSAGDQRLNGSYSQRNALETKADVWEKAELDKLNKRYESMKASILAWEKEKKLRAKIKMERRKKEMEKKMRRGREFYESKVSRIDEIAGGARAQVDEKRRNEEVKIKEKAKQIRASGVVPVSCFCF
ncbi:hypothetical protein HRI_001348500 [Hibiscus trionum]|uniref:Remorin C-terminal domain-containing protein n=1 Tax=Hibiscus trionum TaxID=183268 RepID=A0A9W7HG24_HIBTR|nr:hypothetical protein HRI_001348500 [Hibiscus trionum]